MATLGSALYNTVWMQGLVLLLSPTLENDVYLPISKALFALALRIAFYLPSFHSIW